MRHKTQSEDASFYLFYKWLRVFDFLLERGRVKRGLSLKKLHLPYANLMKVSLTEPMTAKISNITSGVLEAFSWIQDNYKLYEGNTVIDEGTFDNYYPTRFELWFKSESSGIEKKLTEKNYVIDGWDR